MALNDIITLNITAQTASPSRAGFGTPLILDYHTVFPERVRVYTAVADMITDGFTASDLAVSMATSIFAQNPRPPKVIVGRTDSAPVRSFKITPLLAGLPVSGDVTVLVNGQAATYTTDATPTVAEATAALKTAIDTLAISGVSTTDNTTDLDIDGTAGTEIYIECDRTVIERKDNTPDPGIVADLALVQAVNDDWYSVHVTYNSEAVILALAANIETQRRLFITESADDDILDSGSTTDVASDLESANYARTALMYHTKPHQYAGAAWAGKLLPGDPGSATWKFKTLAGITTDVFSATERTNLAAKTANYYEATAGVSITQQGYSSSGEFIDITRFVDWLHARMQERIFGILINAAKVSFDDPGIGKLSAAIQAQLDAGVTAGGLAADPAPAVVAPLAADVSAADKAARSLTGVTFTGTLAGAIHSLVINGTVSV